MKCCLPHMQSHTDKSLYAFKTCIYLWICKDQESNNHECVCEHIAMKKCEGGNLEYQLPSAAYVTQRKGVIKKLMLSEGALGMCIWKVITGTASSYVVVVAIEASEITDKL